ncbi:Crp/Fnr family transcriptional regulator, partial [Meiothermus sp. PNK-Is4]
MKPQSSWNPTAQIWSSYTIDIQRLLECLLPSARETLRTQGRSKTLRTGEVASPMGEPMVAYVHRGWFKLMRFTEYGDEQLMAVRRKGSFIGLETLTHPRDAAPEVVAIAPGEITVWPFELVQSLIERELELTRCFLHLLADQIEEESNLRFLNQSTRVPARLARIIYLYALEEGQPSGKGLYIRMPFTQYDLALLLGVRRETVSLSLAELEGEGVIQRTGKDVVVDVERMPRFLESEGASYGCPKAPKP